MKILAGLLFGASLVSCAKGGETLHQHAPDAGTTVSALDAGPFASLCASDGERLCIEPPNPVIANVGRPDLSGDDIVELLSPAGSTTGFVVQGRIHDCEADDDALIIAGTNETFALDLHTGEVTVLEKDDAVVSTVALDPDTFAWCANGLVHRQARKPRAPHPIDVEAAARRTVLAWNYALDSHDVHALGNLYADNVRFYGKVTPKEGVVAAKRAALSPTSTFHQEIEGAIVTKVEAGIVTATFQKASGSFAGKQSDVLAVLRLGPESGGRLVILEETDKATEDRERRVEKAKR